MRWISVRAYERDGLSFTKLGTAGRVTSSEGAWTVTEEALVGPGGRRLARVAGHVAFWFAWDGYLGARSELYQPK